MQQKIIDVKHITGKVNIADLFTKEDRDTQHFTFIRDIILKDVPSFDQDKNETTLGSEGGVRTST